MLNLEEISKMSESNTWKKADGNVIKVNEAKAKNVKNIRRNVWENEEMKDMRESFQRKFGFDFADKKKFPVLEDNFSWNKAAQKLGYRNVKTALREADSATTFTQLLRAGIQSIVNSMYETVPTTFESWCTVVNSSLDTELYAPLHGVNFLREVGKQEIYSESQAAGLDIKLVNRKYGTLFAVEKELLEDDQTGQMAKQVGLLGEYAKQALEAIVYAKLAGVFLGGVEGQYANLIIPNTETKPAYEANYPWTSTGFRGGGINAPGTYNFISQAGVQAGFIGLMNQRNLLGLKMSVDPNRLLISPQDRFNAAILLNSAFYPSAVGTTAGTVGGTFSINPIESIASLTVTRFMFNNDGTVTGNSRAWYLIDDSKPWFVCQLRQAAEVVQENPTSGQSFDRDVVRFKLSLRGNADHIDPRFAWQGNNGSAVS